MKETNRKNVPVETERRYLIAYPRVETLLSMPGVQIWHIVQTYLCAEKEVTARVRRVEENGCVRYIHTEKRRISSISSYETERELNEKEYEQLLKTADRRLRPVQKTRYRIPYGELFWEIDVYPFWHDRAILEIELPTEDIQPPLPAWITVLREISGEKKYANRALAETVPTEKISG